MWTTEKDDWVLSVRTSASGQDVYTICYLPNLGDLIIEVDEWYEYVVQQMKEAGNRILSSSDLAKLMPPMPEGWVPQPLLESASDEPPDTDQTAS